MSSSPTSTTSIPFWTSHPSTLFEKEYIFELWPLPQMTYNQKMNAISRLVIILTIVGFMITMSTKFLAIGVLTLLVIYILFNMPFTKGQRGLFGGLFGSGSGSEGFTAPVKITNSKMLEKVLDETYYSPMPSNPLGNVLLTDITDIPDRPSAEPAFNPLTSHEINENAKMMVQQLNPGIKDTNKQLFGDLIDNFNFDQSMWSYYATPNTKIANDQGAYAHFLYGDMPSCRDGSSFACIQDNLRYINI